MPKPLTAALPLLASLVTLLPRIQADQPTALPARVIRHSDVVFMVDDPTKYQAYGCTVVVGWGERPEPDHVKAAHAQGVRLYSGSVGFVTESTQVIDFSPEFLDADCRNFAGQTFVVPWLWDQKYKGQPAWWPCTNSPLYRQYLESRLQETMKADVDGLHIDDYRGSSAPVTWLSGGFCRHCMAGFREYLARQVPKERLAALGVSDLANFDYRQFLLDRGVKPEEYNDRRPDLPLAAEFYDFQVKADTEFVRQYRQRAEALRGKPLALAVNSGLEDPQALAIAPVVSYFCCEVEHTAAAAKLPLHPLYIYKLADGLGRPMAPTAYGQDWAHVKQHRLPCLVRTWIAQSYAFGQNFMPPHHEWCYTQEKGTHWYDGPTEEYAWLYQFVHAQARLLDGYEAVAPIALVYDNAARRKGRGDIEPIATALAGHNLPFAVVIAGDDWLPYRLDARELSKFQAVIVAKDPAMDAIQKMLLDQIAAEGRLVVWPDDQLLAKLVPPPLVIEGTDQVLAIPRAIPGDNASPLVIHLLNRQYEAQRDALVPQEDFVVRLRPKLLGSWPFTKAILHEPKNDERPLEVTSLDGAMTIKIPRLELWGILELTR
jgi:hypothetical protein